MKTTRNSVRKSRLFYGNSPSKQQGLSNANAPRNLSVYTSVASIDEQLALLDAQEAAGTISPATARTQRSILLTRRRALEGRETMPPEGTVRVTRNCIISRIGGNIVITFRNGADADVQAGCRMQGFTFNNAGDSGDTTCTAPFTTARYIFALELCEGYERVESGLDANAVRSVIASYIEQNPIGFEGLSAEVQAAIRGTQTIMIQTSPDRPPIRADGIEDIQDAWKIIDDILLGHNVFLFGPAGTGKTYLAEWVARRLERQYVTLNCSQYTSPTEIKGGPTITGYQEGALIDCWENGKIFIIDELPKIDPNVAGLLNEALAKTKVPVGDTRAVIYNGKNQPKSKAEGFGVIATGNVFPTAESQAYTANTRQDLSLLDRFSGSVYYVGFNPVVELDNAGSRLVWSVGMRIRQWILDNRVDSTISLRWLQTAGSVFRLERDRMSGNRADSELLDRGKTLKAHVDGIIITFNPGQQEQLRAWLRYDELFADPLDRRHYRNLDPDVEIVF